MYTWLIPDWQALSQTAQSGRLGHAWLLLGDPGLGKEQLAERLACFAPLPATGSRRAVWSLPLLPAV